MKSHRLINTLFRKHIARHGLTNSQCSQLLVLSKRREISQNTLGQVLFLEKSSVKRNMEKLTERGYFDKTAQPKIVITAAGLKKIDSVIPAWNAAMQEATNLLGDDGIAALDLVLTKLAS